jgi:thioredoxin-related protein
MIMASEDAMKKLLLILFCLFPAIANAEPTLGDDGLHKQPWFSQSFLELADDLDEAAENDRLLMVVVEQAGCPYCREMHRVNFERAEIVDEITKSYLAVQLDLWGSREVVDFDGSSMEERDWIQKNAIHFTPTTLFFKQGDDGRAREVFRMPGYFKPFHHLSALKYVASEAYLDQPFQRFLQTVFAEFEAQGIDPNVWNE